MTVAVLLGLALAVGYLSISTPLYTASTEVMVVTETNGPSASELVRGNDFAQDQVRSFIAVAKRAVVLDPVIESLGLSGTPAELAQTLSVSSLLNTSIIRISATSPDPEQAAAVANAVVAQLDAAASEFGPRSADDKPVVRMELVEAATVPQAPSSPDRTLALALGLLGGLALGAVAVAVKESLDNKVRSAADVATVTGAPLLGTIAQTSQAATRPLIRGENDQSPRAESFRHIRTSLQFLRAVNPSPLTAVSSAIPGEGKTTSAVNLALVVASTGGRVCIVEADLRRPRVAHYLGLDSSVGLTTVLVGDCRLDEAVQSYGRSGLDVLASGMLPPNPSELLNSPRMKELLAELAARYDTVIIDTAPLIPVTDGRLIAQECGGVVLVVGAGVVTRSELAETVALLAAGGVPITGTIVNRIKRQEGGQRSYSYESDPAPVKAKSKSAAQPKPADRQKVAAGTKPEA